MAYSNNKSKPTFNPDNYETVKSRKTRLRTDFPNSIIYPMQISGIHYSNQFVVFLSLIWKDKDTRIATPEVMSAIVDMTSKITVDNASIVASTIGLFMGADSIGYSLSIAGGSSADKNAWMENCEESASGRALDNLGYHGNTASREEMQKVVHTQQVQDEHATLCNSLLATLAKLQTSQHVDISALEIECQRAINKTFVYFYELTIEELYIVQNILNQYL